MKKTYVYSKETGTMVEKAKNYAERQGPYILGDIEPYRAMGPEFGRLITSRSQHREYLRRYNLTEVGNEKAAFFGDKK